MIHINVSLWGKSVAIGPLVLPGLGDSNNCEVISLCIITLVYVIAEIIFLGDSSKLA